MIRILVPIPLFLRLSYTYIISSSPTPSNSEPPSNHILRNMKCWGCDQSPLSTIYPPLCFTDRHSQTVNTFSGDLQRHLLVKERRYCAVGSF